MWTGHNGCPPLETHQRHGGIDEIEVASGVAIGGEVKAEVKARWICNLLSVLLRSVFPRKLIDQSTDEDRGVVH